MLIPLHGDRLLLPNAAVAEIIGYREPDPLQGVPDWLRGQVNWQQRQVPVVDFERLLGRGDQPPGIRQRIAICYAPAAEADCPLFGIVAQGIPRLLRISRSLIDDAERLERKNAAVQMSLLIDGEKLLVPKLQFLQEQLSVAA
jgi:chemosensory pili system protein ChpC